MDPLSIFLAFVAGMILMFFMKNAAIKAAHKAEAEALRLNQEIKAEAYRLAHGAEDEAQRAKEAAKLITHS